MTPEALTDLLDHSLQYDAEYAGKLSNHLPMLLVALQRLGADEQRLQQAGAAYAQRLHPMPPLQTWFMGDIWPDSLGQPLAWPKYRDLFTRWIDKEGGPVVLQQVLPALMPGCGAAAFHGLIRTAYALQSGHKAELAHALAYWACRWLDLGLPPAAEPAPDSRPDVAALLARTAQVPGVAESPSRFIVERLHHAAWQPGFAQAMQGWRPGDQTLQQLARHAARLYARSGNFTVLHLVTSAWSLRCLLPQIDSQPRALTAYAWAYAAGAASEAPRLKLSRAPAALPWPDLVQAALHSDDEHLVKLVHVCQEEQQAWGGADDWQRAATRAVRDARDHQTGV